MRLSSKIRLNCARQLVGVCCFPPLSSHCGHEKSCQRRANVRPTPQMQPKHRPRKKQTRPAIPGLNHATMSCGSLQHQAQMVSVKSCAWRRQMQMQKKLAVLAQKGVCHGLGRIFRHAEGLITSGQEPVGGGQAIQEIVKHFFGRLEELPGAALFCGVAEIDTCEGFIMSSKTVEQIREIYRQSSLRRSRLGRVPISGRGYRPGPRSDASSETLLPREGRRGSIQGCP